MLFVVHRLLFPADGPAGRRDGLETTPPCGLHPEAADCCCECQHADREVEAQEKSHFSTGVCRSLLMGEHRSECGSRLCSQRSESFISTERSLKSTVGRPEHQRSQAKSWESPPACTFTQDVSV